MEIRYKIILLGDPGVGKTSAMAQYCCNEFVENTFPTIGIAYRPKNVEYEGETIKVDIWDTGGQDRYDTITKTYCQGSYGAIIIYDITRHSTFLKVENWINKFRSIVGPDILIVLVGNKSDLRGQTVREEEDKDRDVTTREGIDYATDKKLAFFETSAKTSENVAAAFNELLIQIHKNKSNFSLIKKQKTGTIALPKNTVSVTKPEARKKKRWC